MANIAQLQIQVVTTGAAGASQQLGQVNVNLQRAATGARQASASIQQTDASFLAFTRTVRLLRGVLAVVAIKDLVGFFADLSDAATKMASQLRLVTESTANLNRIQAELYQAAQGTRSSLEETVTLYAKMFRATESLALSQRELINVTTSIQQAMKISGATTQEASSAMIQFGQALASGRFQGDELRSILENFPRLARVIADGMGVTIGELRKLGSAGEITSAQVISAIQQQSGKIKAEFSQLPKTIADSWQQVKNALVQNFVEIGNSSKGTISMLDKLREAIESPGFTAFLEGLLTFLGGFGTALASAAAVIGDGMTALSGKRDFLMGQALKDAREEAAALTRELPDLIRQLDYMRAGNSQQTTPIGAPASNLSHADQVDALAERIQVAQSKISEVSLQDPVAQMEQYRAELERVNSKLMEMNNSNFAQNMFVDMAGGESMAELEAKSKSLSLEILKLAPVVEGAKLSLEDLTNASDRASTGFSRMMGEWSKDLAQTKELISVQNNGSQAIFGMSAKYDVLEEAKKRNIVLTDEEIAQAINLKRQLDQADDRLKESEDIRNKGFENATRLSAAETEYAMAKKGSSDAAERAAHVMNYETKLRRQLETATEGEIQALVQQESAAFALDQKIKNLNKSREEQIRLAEKLYDIEMELAGAKDKQALVLKAGPGKTDEAAIDKVDRDIKIRSDLKGLSGDKIDGAIRMADETERLNTLTEKAIDLHEGLKDASVKGAEEQYKAQQKLALTIYDPKAADEKLDRLMREYEIRRDLVGASDEQIEAILKQYDATEQLNLITDSVIATQKRQVEMQKEMARNVRQLGSAIGSTLSDILTGADSAEDALKRMVLRMAEMAFQNQIINLIGMAAGAGGPGGQAVGAFSNFVFGGASKNGNAFGPTGRVSAFRNGGVVNRPSYFGMRDGGMGVAGEDGANSSGEGILPLRRMQNGQLGVQSNGARSGEGGGVITLNAPITINLNGKADEGSPEKIGAEVEQRLHRVIDDRIINQKRPGGMLR